jgi:hypothetical protein
VELLKGKRKKKNKRKPGTWHRFLYKGLRLDIPIISSKKKLLYEDLKE